MPWVEVLCTVRRTVSICMDNCVWSLFSHIPSAGVRPFLCQESQPTVIGTGRKDDTVPCSEIEGMGREGGGRRGEGEGEGGGEGRGKGGGERRGRGREGKRNEKGKGKGSRDRQGLSTGRDSCDSNTATPKIPQLITVSGM